MRPFFSLIIPCYNSKATISRVVNSLKKQGINDTDLEIIIVDDNSSDLSYQEIVKECGFSNIVFTETNVTIHCPGNTRRKGMEFVTGEWLCFCDHDDYFEDGALAQVKAYIETRKMKPLVVNTIICSYDEEHQICEKKLMYKQAWLHGKFYNVDDFIKPYGINFKENLVTHEDVYFNSLVLNYLYKLNMNWDCLDILTYRWVEQADSITRLHREDRGYLYENFGDYIISASEPYWKYAVETRNPIAVNQVLMTLLHSYFYYEAASYYYGPTDYKDIIQLIKNYLNKIVLDFQMTLDDIVNYVYSDPMRYRLVREDCELNTMLFIPKTSFRDFVYRLGEK